MSYVSLLKNLPEFLSQPTGIAAIASVGIHGAIALLLPIVPMDSKPKQEASSKNSVGLVELSQAEQSRLPKPGTPQLSLQPQAPVLPQVPPPSFANQSIPSLPPMPPAAASTDLILPPLPRTNNIAIASLPKSQSLPILSQRDLQPSPSFSTKVRPFPRYVDRVQLGESKPLESSRIPYNVPSVQAANISQAQEMINTSAPVRSEQMPAASSSEGSTATQTTESGGEGSQVARQQLVTPVVQPPLAGDNSIALRGQNLPQLPQGSNFTVPKLPSLVPESPSLATEQLASKPKTFVERFSEAKKQYPDLETKQPIAAIINAKAEEEGNVEGDLVINGAGQVESIGFHDNSVSSDLKTSVREYFREYFQKNPVQANGKPKFYPFNISFKSNSSNISKTPAPELSTSSQVNQTQPITQAQRSLIQRLRPVEVNSLPSKEPQKVKLTQPLRPEAVNQQVSQSRQTSVAPQANQQRQTSRQQVIQRQTTSAPQANQQRQTSRQQVVVRQSASSSQTDTEQQTSQQQVVVKQTTSAPPANQEQASQQEVSSNLPATSVESSKKLIRQLREFRDKRHGGNQEQ
ncbi:hypothetical protein [Mastigocladopsis repens]|uniref:hypothetical protein n=1 Tax=Mastigocladopsis repens TaxID=221287 RepID=UPI00036696E7|nr:hypothetical protein [Mastigocladopsis repens]